jgi:transcriptional regulator with XRE-family HTH domain
MAARRLKRTERLGEKLLDIRNGLGLSQSEMLRRLGYEDVLPYNRISDYELGKRVPPLPVVLEYAKVAGVHLEDIVDDGLDLPDRLPGSVRHTGVKRKSVPRIKTR